MATAPGKVTSTQMKSFICENSNILNHETKLAILQIVSLEVGPDVLIEKTGPPPEVDVDLDAVGAANEEVISHIYNIVVARRSALSQPAGLAPPAEKK